MIDFNLKRPLTNFFRLKGVLDDLGQTIFFSEKIKKSFRICYQKDFYSLNYNLRLTHPMSVTTMPCGVLASPLHSFHKLIIDGCRFHFLLIFVFWLYADSIQKKTSAVCRGLILYFKFTFNLNNSVLCGYIPLTSMHISFN